MRFLHRHWFFLVFAAVLTLCSVLVIRQYLANQWAHVGRREDFLLLHEVQRPEAMARLYQMLIQELPGLPDHALVDDDQRLAFFLAQKNPSPDDLAWKYRVSVQNELQRRTDQRVARALKHAAGK